MQQFSADRRGPDRHLVALRLLRRVAVTALVVSAVLAIGPRLLMEAGLLGPGPDEAIEEATRSVALARSYGATEALAPMQAAERELAAARQRRSSGQGREARRAAGRASSFASEAQKLALVSRAANQRRAERVYNDLDRQINDLEKLYSSVTPALQREQVGELLSIMKVTRATAGAVFLAYEQQDYDGVITSEGNARSAIARAKGELQQARTR
jgi:hypothetical protein